MKLDAATTIRVVKRLNAAVGYHELGMNQHALQCLDDLQQMGDTGPFALAEQVLRAEFLKSRQDYGGAAIALEKAARMVPSPQNHGVWLALSICYRQPAMPAGSGTSSGTNHWGDLQGFGHPRLVRE
jgi:hypothetical protein